jgi:Sigma-70, region 4
VRLQGCLGRVPRAERRVLKLRAGLGIARTRSRADVARITGIPRARVARLERRGLRHLRALGRQGACAVAPTAGATTVAALPVGAPQSGGPQSGAGHGQVLAERHSGTSRPPKPESEGSTKQSLELPLGRPGSASTGGSSSFDFTLVLIPLALALLAFLLVREVRRTT